MGSGTTGTLGGVAERLRQVFPGVRVVAVEPVGSVTFGGRPGKRNIPGIGTSVRPKLAGLVKPDRIVAVDERTTIETCLSFAKNGHLLVGGSTGSVLAAVRQLSGEFLPGETIVAISPDLGEKYLDTIYDPAWVSAVLRYEEATINPPASIRRPLRRPAIADVGAGIAVRAANGSAKLPHVLDQSNGNLDGE